MRNWKRNMRKRGEKRTLFIKSQNQLPTLINITHNFSSISSRKKSQEKHCCKK
jgi:hypothetical protein